MNININIYISGDDNRNDHRKDSRNDNRIDTRRKKRPTGAQLPYHHDDDDDRQAGPDDDDDGPKVGSSRFQASLTDTAMKPEGFRTAY